MLKRDDVCMLLFWPKLVTFEVSAPENGVFTICSGAGHHPRIQPTPDFLPENGGAL